MSDTPKLTLPKELEIYRSQIESTVKPVVKISTSKIKTDIYQSKFAGYPYLPKTMEHPKDARDRPMKLLAQLNFEEIPLLDNMPKEGILQFFISAEDDVMGIEFDNMTNQKNFKVLFHDKIEKDKSLLVSDFSYLDDLDTEYFPMQHELSLIFNIEYEPVSIADFKIDELLGDSVDLSVQVSDGEGEKELWEVYNDTFLGDGHKVGGYPYFTQSDPRDYEKSYVGQDILLLQIDSDFDKGIMWGDSGIANFFIKKEDLLNLNFSNVIYNWDCH
ncbi:YwqG family protein [Aquisalibacillus elongatus]|uniref:Uncharacterized protein YwqG n=1 Tax=Aquisalibacillus elongatus TaxID=485577 RepID=A0A3N5BHJ6_9BACI|nr:YwqG family protein [Aquisalibacillus elongatus]RPF57077.1 uncharacterized protein YwqG [Aquisalibacillus elongatus]